MMKRRATIATIATIAIAAVLAVAGCSGTPAIPAKVKATPIGALSAAEAARPVQPVVASVAPAIAKKADLIFGAGYQSRMDGKGQATLPTRTGTAAMMTVVDAQHRVLARAISVRLAGFKPAPVVVDYTSTAFTRLATTAPFLTDNPLALVVLRAAADQSPHLNALGVAMSAHAATDANYLATPTATEINEVTALAKDVTSTLKAWAASVAGSATAGPKSAFPQAMLSGAATATSPVCNVGIEQVEPISATGICLSSTKDEHGGGYAVTGKNTGPSWAFVYAYDDSALPVGAIQPHTFSVPTINAIVEALLKDTLTAQGMVLVAAACKAVSWMGHDCPTAPEFNPFKTLKSLITGLNQDGEGEFTLTAKQATKKVYVVTLGAKQGSLGMLPAGADLTSAQAIPALMTTWSQIGQPLLNLMAGNGAGEESVPSSRLKSTLQGLRSALVGSKAEGQIVNFVKQLRDGNYVEAMTAMTGIAGTLLADTALLATLLQVVAPSLGVAKVTEMVLTKILSFGADLIPGPGWVKAVIDGANYVALGANLAMGTIWMATGLATIANVGGYKAINPDDYDVLKDVDWANAAYLDVAHDYFSQSHESFRLRGGQLVLPPLLSSGAFEFKLIRPVLYGMVQGKPSAVAIVVQNIGGNQSCGWDNAHHFVFQVAPGGKVVLAALGYTPFDCSGMTTRARWAIQGDALEEYTELYDRPGWTRVRFAFGTQLTAADFWSPANLPVGAKRLAPGKASLVQGSPPAGGAAWIPPGQ